MPDDNRNHQVSLGCGTLILIALIVLFFSGRGTNDVAREVRELRSDVGELKKSIETQNGELKLLLQKLDKQPKAADAAKDL